MDESPEYYWKEGEHGFSVYRKDGKPVGMLLLSAYMAQEITRYLCEAERMRKEEKNNASR